MANVLDLRRRIRSVKSTRQITKAMKMIAAAKLRRAQERAISGRPYANMLASVIGSLMRHIDTYDPKTGDVRHPLLLAREEKQALLIVVSGDKGFAGGFNGNITKAAFRFISEHGEEQIDIAPIGKKARDMFRRRYPLASFVDKQGADDGNDRAADTGDRDPGQPTPAPEDKRRGDRQNQIEVAGEYPGMLDKPSFDQVALMAREVVHRYMEEELDAVYLVYNEFKSVMAQRVVVERILPMIEPGQRDIKQAQEMSQEEREEMARAAAHSGVSVKEADSSEADQEAKQFGTAEVDYIYDQPPRELLDGLLRQYVSSQIYHALIESSAAEQAARMTAMDAATSNASEMIDSLTLTMNRVRQAAITKEIIEIVSGAAAL
ncbi:MAG: F-type H+-transporting ATPase subunit gamma [Acidobacteriaceae bacterium]|nr:F-type H+-transporting ATPase subunit gamma [Acidobacteriaceae bacterium]